LHEPERSIVEDPALRERYTVIARIGSGTFGSVYEAVQRSTGQRVAIKILRPREEKGDATLAQDVERFQRETRLCAQLHHPNIVRLIDSGEIAALLYAVFEFVPGSNLADILAQEGALEPVEALHLMSQVLDALSCSHRLGIVHRDLKPANIMVTSTGARRNAMVLDFGLGVFAHETVRGAGGRLTEDGEYLGTPLYSAPEQLYGKPPTVLSDVYSWALIFIECLAGAPPMRGATAAEVVHAQLREQPVPIPEAITVHPLGQLLRAATVKKPAERRASAEELLRELQRVTPASLPPRDEMANGRVSFAVPAAIAAGPIWKVPLQRNANFTGRAQPLKTLRDTLVADSPPAVVALHGLGGIGKTQIALEYAYRYAQEYDLVAWLRAEGADGLAADYASLTDALGLPERDTRDQYPRIEAVRKWLERNRRWLLIFDNAPTPEALRAYLPHSPSGHVIATSRHQSWRRIGTGIFVDVLDPDEATDFLASRTGEDRTSEAARLCEDLGRLPLALEEAAAYIEATGRSIPTYRRLLETHRFRLLEGGTPPVDYPWTVRSTWEISLKNLENETPNAAHLLSVCAYLAPDDIPLIELREGLTQAGDVALAALHDEMEFDRCLAALRRYSLVKVGESSLSLHRLVQLVTRDRLPEGERARWAELALRVVESVYPRSGLAGDVRPESGRLLPHCLAALDHTESLAQCDECAARLLSRTGIYMSATGVQAQSIEHLTKALRIYERHPEFGDRERAALLDNLGLVQNARGELLEARDYLERAREIHERLDGTDALTVGLDLVSLAWVRRALGDLAEARAVGERGTRIIDAHLGAEHPILVNLQSVTARVLWELGEIADARRLVAAVVAMLHRAKQRFHPMASGAWFQTAQLLFELGDIEGAGACAQVGADVGRPAYGPDHPLVLANLTISGRVLLEREDLAGARGVFERVVNGSRRTCSRPHADLMDSHALLAETQRRCGDGVLARRTAEQGVDLVAAIAGEPTRTRALLHLVLGNVLADQGDLNGARAEQRSARELLERRLGSGHPALLSVLNASARIELRAAAYDAAQATCEQALAIGARSGLDDHLDVAACLEILAEACADRGRTAEAAQHLARAQKIVAQRLGERSVRARRQTDRMTRFRDARVL
jgi:tetratricopeptide (TPR) repeat protein/tRNA A-37 threonylcarbamoyl transferase component Bud32